MDHGGDYAAISMRRAPAGSAQRCRGLRRTALRLDAAIATFLTALL